MNKCYIILLHLALYISVYAQPDLQTVSLHLDSIQVEAGWNLLSLPINVTDSTKNSIFPTAVSQAFIFQDGYRAVESLENGTGFWLKFDSAETVYMTGTTIYYDTIEVHTGWNMIGSISKPVPIDSIKCDPSDLITSNYFSYKDGTYHSTDTLQPGFGTWVKIKQNGYIILLGDTIPVIGVPCSGIPMVEYAGKRYNTVQIGNQCWLKENLDIGTMIVGLNNPQTNNGTIEKYCYNDDPNNCNTYGGLYQWNEAMQYTTTSGTKGICPSGWHIPTYTEFHTLSTTMGGDGNTLKEIGEGIGAGAGTNTSGFSALLSGNLNNIGYFYDLGNLTYFWSSTEYYTGYAYGMVLYWFDRGIYDSYGAYRGYGFNDRCVKN